VLDDEEALREVLLHEMAHAAVYQGDPDDEPENSDEADHDRRFLAELLRLLRAGAPINPMEFDTYGGEGYTGADLQDQANSPITIQGTEVPCVYCGEKVTALDFSMTRHRTTCAAAPEFARAEAKTSLLAFIPAVSWVSKDSNRVFITMKRGAVYLPVLVVDVSIFEHEVLFEGRRYTDNTDVSRAVAARAEREANLDLRVGAGNYSVTDERVYEVARLLAKEADKREV